MMKLITQCYTTKFEAIKDDYIGRMMKKFQAKMKLQYSIPPCMVEKYKDEICFMVKINTTYMEAVEPRVKFIEPMSYEMLEGLIEGYEKIILKSKRDTKCPRWGAYEEKMREVHKGLYTKEAKKKLEKKI